MPKSQIKWLDSDICDIGIGGDRKHGPMTIDLHAPRGAISHVELRFQSLWKMRQFIDDLDRFCTMVEGYGDSH